MAKKEESRFRIIKKGYSRFEVDATLKNYESQIEQYKNQLEEYENKIQQLTEELNVVTRRYKTLLNAIEIKEKAADEMTRLALKEANDVIGSAQKNADVIVEEALLQARIILTDLYKISDGAQTMKTDMKRQLEEMGDKLDDFEPNEVPKVDWYKEKIED